MSEATLSDFAPKIKGIDFVTLLTHGEGDRIVGRPMSNGGGEYDGTSTFFALESTSAVQDLSRNPAATLSVAGDRSPEGRPGIFATIEGVAELSRDNARFAPHWHGGVGRFFPDGPATQGLVMITVRAKHIHFWNAGQEGEISL